MTSFVISVCLLHIPLGKLELRGNFNHYRGLCENTLSLNQVKNVLEEYKYSM